MKTIQKDSLLFLGDIHGCFVEIDDLSFNVTKSLIIQVGDVGLGFHNFDYELQTLTRLDESCAVNENELVLMRGNHDSKERFVRLKEEGKFSNIHLVEDYEIIRYNDKTIQFVGGAISIDRTARREGTSYWSDEGVVYSKKKCKKVDILVAHTAPSWCFPCTFNDLVLGWATDDKTLLKELTNERKTLDKIFDLCKPSLFVYGHFHTSWTDNIKDCKCKLLNINEVWEYKI